MRASYYAKTSESYARRDSRRSWYGRPKRLFLSEAGQAPVAGQRDIEHIPQLHAIEEATRKALALLELERDWDDEDAQPIDKNAFEAAANFVKTNSLRLWEAYGLDVTPPKIMPTPDGGIDVLWRTSVRDLLMSFPPDGGKPHFYGDDRDVADVKIKGNLDLAKNNEWLLAWLCEK